MAGFFREFFFVVCFRNVELTHRNKHAAATPCFHEKQNHTLVCPHLPLHCRSQRYQANGLEGLYYNFCSCSLQWHESNARGLHTSSLTSVTTAPVPAFDKRHMSNMSITVSFLSPCLNQWLSEEIELNFGLSPPLPHHTLPHHPFPSTSQQSSGWCLSRADFHLGVDRCKLAIVWGKHEHTHKHTHTHTHTHKSLHIHLS